MSMQHIVAPPARAAMFLVLTVNDDTDPGEIRAFLGELAGITRSVSLRVPEDNLTCVVGIGSHLWDRLFPAAAKPCGLHPFEAIHGERHTAPATPGDLLLHLRADTAAMCFELARLVSDRLQNHARIVDEVHGFRYFDSRDLLGFVDGTENPEGDEAREVVTISAETDPQYAGGSYVIVQKYLHDLAGWNALSVEEQERAIGRSKLDDVEMDDDVKPANSHVALNVVRDEHGNPLQILRDNMPFGEIGSGEYGTYFIAYSADPAVTERMLHNMFIGDPPGTTDRVLDFSTAVTGSLYFVPSAAFLNDPPG